MIELYIRERLVKNTVFCSCKITPDPCVLKDFGAKTSLSLPLNQVCAFCHPYKAFQIWSTIPRCGKKHGYQIFHRDLLKPNSKYFQRFHLCHLAQLLPVIRLSMHRPHRMTEQSLAGCTKGQTRGNPRSIVPGRYFELQQCYAAEMRVGSLPLLSWNAARGSQVSSFVCCWQASSIVSLCC